MKTIEPFDFDYSRIYGMDLSDGAKIIFNGMIEHYNSNIVAKLNELIEQANVATGGKDGL